MAMWPIQLPYGLSTYHRHVRTTGKGAALPYGEQPRWRAFTLTELASVTLTTPSTAPTTLHSHPSQTHTLARSELLRKRRRNLAFEFEVGVSGSVFREPRLAAAKPQDRHGKRPRSQSNSTQLSRNLVQYASRRSHKHKRRKPLGPGTRPGAHRDVPISIDSDDDDVSIASPEAFADARSRAYSLPAVPVGSATLAARKASATLLQTQQTQGIQDLPSCSPSQEDLCHDEASYEERVVSLEPATPIKASTRARLRRLPIPSHSSASEGALSATSRPTEPSSRASSLADDGFIFTLADIPDFDLRRKTAQLMAVAPSLPVTDLYYLLMQRNGRFDAAVKDAIRASQAPSNRINPARETAAVRSATVPLTDPARIPGKLKVEPEIKIDFDDPVFTWDNDAPTTPQRRQQQNQKKSKKNSMTQSVTSSKGFAKMAETGKGKGDTMKCARSHVGQSSNRTGAVNRGIRATSYDLEFIVPDDEMTEESDDTYSDIDESDTSDVDMTDDGTDLLIDMEPEFAYNSDILGSP